MNRLRAIVHDERGIAVVLGLIALLTLTALVLAFLAVSAFEPQISRNLADGTKARYLAEAGLEEALDTLTTNINGNWNTYLTGATCTTARRAWSSAPRTRRWPGLTSASGTYTVRIRNDCQANDPMLTGVTADTSGTTEGNGHVILTSQGNFGSATRTMTVVATRVGNLFNTSSPYQLNAALSFPGYETDTSLQRLGLHRRWPEPRHQRQPHDRLRPCSASRWARRTSSYRPAAPSCSTRHSSRPR